MMSPLSVWESLSCFHSAEMAQKYLKKCYQKISLNEADVQSYNNCYPFIYYLEQGELYFKQALATPLSIQPILLFYGYIHLIKACILTIDPFYPQNTSVLAHGVTSRKRKKQQYSFLKDEIKIQKNGLLSHFAKEMFHVKHLEAEKYQMGELLSQIPEMDDTFKLIFNKRTHIPLSLNGKILSFPDEILHHYHMSEERLHQFLKEKTENKVDVQDGQLSLQDSVYGEIPPIRLNNKTSQYSLSCDRTQAYTLPEPIIHYLLLYNLSMIARYETEWWSELLKSNSSDDYPIIKNFLYLSLEKPPALIKNYLLSNL
ncbi:YaaC family protein [Rossellomorea vietnamensis]|uniref:YaaC family protein n=1 Tax=Rossellomorea vietnamensis TaxID=218284 RepID=UPI003CF23E01